MTVTTWGTAKVVALALGAGLVFGAAMVLGFEVATWDRITPGVSVLDEPLGGLTVEEAQNRLAPRALSIVDQQLVLRLGERQWSTSARALGVRLDPAQLAQSAYVVGRDGTFVQRLQTQLETLRGGAEVAVIEQADGGRLDALVADIAAQVNTPARDAHLRVDDAGRIDFGTSATGLQVDQAAARSVVAQALTIGEPEAAIEARTLQPAMTTEQVAAAHEQIERILAPQPVQVSAADYSRTLQQADLLGMVSLSMPTSSADVANVTLNAEALEPLLDEAAKAVEQTPVNARVTWSGSKVTVTRPSQDGRGLDRAAASDLLGQQILAGSRAIQLPVSVVKPAVPADEVAARFDAPDLIEQSTTSFAGSVPEKAANIRLAAQRLNGVVVPPGGTFSFNDEVGPTTLESGFQWGFGLVTGAQGGAHTVPSVAGGICQVATTLFQSVFWGGYQLEERYWHLYWIPAYTSRDVVGIDATVDEDSGLDFKWINPTDDFVLIQAFTDADHVTFRLYGKKPAWTVQLEPPVISDRVAPDTTPDVQPEPLLPWGRVVPVETARDGFQVVLTRHVVGADASKTRDLVLKSIYQPGHNVTLVGSGGAPDAGIVAAAVDRVRDGLQPAPARAAAPTTSEPPAQAAAPTGYDTPNGQRTMAEIRDELRGAGWGGGSDQDAVATYNRLAEAAAGH